MKPKEPIKVGDRVEWRDGGWKHGETCVGVVTEMYPSCAAVRVRPNVWYYPEIKKLKRIETASITKAQP